MIDPIALRTTLEQMLAAVGQIERHPKLGYQGPARPLRIGAYLEFITPAGEILIADPHELTKEPPVLALRQWVTWRAGKMGGRQAVEAGNSGLNLGLGGLGIGGLLRIFTGMGTIPGLQLGTTTSGNGVRVTPEMIQQLIRGYLLDKKIPLLLPAEEES